MFLKYVKFKKKFEALNKEEKYVLILLIIKYWEENGIETNSNKKIYPKDIKFNNSKEFITELEILNFLINVKTIKIFNLFVRLDNYNKINFIAEEFLNLNDYSMIRLRFNDKLSDYAYNLIKFQKIMLLKN